MPRTFIGARQFPAIVCIVKPDEAAALSTDAFAFAVTVGRTAIARTIRFTLVTRVARARPVYAAFPVARALVGADLRDKPRWHFRWIPTLCRGAAVRSRCEALITLTHLVSSGHAVADPVTIAIHWARRLFQWRHVPLISTSTIWCGSEPLIASAGQIPLTLAMGRTVAGTESLLRCLRHLALKDVFNTLRNAFLRGRWRQPSRLWGAAVLRSRESRIAEAFAVGLAFAVTRTVVGAKLRQDDRRLERLQHFRSVRQRDIPCRYLGYSSIRGGREATRFRQTAIRRSLEAWLTRACPIRFTLAMS